MAQHPRPLNPISVVVPSSPEMFQGAAPDRPRIRLAPRIPLPVAQPTHVSAPFSAEMTQGYHPDLPVLGKPASLGWLWVTPEGELQDPAETRGYHPDQPVLQLAPRIPLPLAQPTPVTLFSPEMAQGSRPSSPVLRKPPALGWWWLTAEVGSYSVEMGQGSHPDSPRLFVAPRFMQPPAQPTPVAAPFSIEQVVGWRPIRPILGKPLPSGWLWLTPEIVTFSTEQAQGSRPDRPRLFLAPRFQQPPSQVSPVAAPFSPEMAQGVRWWPPPTTPSRAGFVILIAPITGPTPPNLEDRWAPVGYVLHVQEQSSGRYQAQLMADDGITFLPGTILTDLRLTLYTIGQDGSSTIVNLRDHQIVLNAGGVTVDPSGLITWSYSAADTTLVDPLVPFERHIALFEWSWLGGHGEIEVILVVHNLHRVP